MATFFFPFQKIEQVSQVYIMHNKVVENEIVKQNENLLSRMLKIETEPMRNTINIIPKTIPSNKETFLELKARERKAESNGIRKENMVCLCLFRKSSISFRMLTRNTTQKRCRVTGRRIRSTGRSWSRRNQCPITCSS